MKLLLFALRRPVTIMVLVAAMAGLLVPLEIPQRYLSKFLSAAAGAWPHPFLTMST